MWLTVKVATLVPELPSVMVTSLIEMLPTPAAVSSLAMVPSALALDDGAAVGRAHQVDEKRLIGFDGRVAVDGHRYGLGEIAGGEAHSAGRLATSRCRRSPCRPPWHRSTVEGRGSAGPAHREGGRSWSRQLPSVIVTSLIEMLPTTAAVSSLVMVPIPWLLTMVPPLVALNRLTKNVSSGSTVVSPLMVTEMVWTAPLRTRRRSSECLKSRRSRSRRSPCRLPWHSRRRRPRCRCGSRVNVAAWCPASPSVIVTSLIEMLPTRPRGVVVGDGADALALDDGAAVGAPVRLTKTSHWVRPPCRR